MPSPHISISSVLVSTLRQNAAGAFSRPPFHVPYGPTCHPSQVLDSCLRHTLRPDACVRLRAESKQRWTLMLIIKSRARGKIYRRCCESGQCARRCKSPSRSACKFPPRPASPVRTRPAAVAINKHNRRDAGTGQVTEASVVACHLVLPAEPRSGPATSADHCTIPISERSGSAGGENGPGRARRRTP